MKIGQGDTATCENHPSEKENGEGMRTKTRTPRPAHYQVCGEMTPGDHNQEDVEFLS